jgi:hypothetical protein
MKSNLKFLFPVFLLVIFFFATPTYSQVGSAGGVDDSSAKIVKPSSVIFSLTDFFSIHETNKVKSREMPNSKTIIKQSTLADLNAIRLKIIALNKEKSKASKKQ